MAVMQQRHCTRGYSGYLWSSWLNWTDLSHCQKLLAKADCVDCCCCYCYFESGDVLDHDDVLMRHHRQPRQRALRRQFRAHDHCELELADHHVERIVGRMLRWLWLHRDCSCDGFRHCFWSVFWLEQLSRYQGRWLTQDCRAMIRCW